MITYNLIFFRKKHTAITVVNNFDAPRWLSRKNKSIKTNDDMNYYEYLADPKFNDMRNKFLLPLKQM